QFASALLLIGSTLSGGLSVELQPDAVSVPYIAITQRVLGEFGVDVRQTDPRRWEVAEGRYPGREFTVEGDHSSASYFLAAAATCGGRVRCDGLRSDSAQPDAELAAILDAGGCGVERGADHLTVEGSGGVRAFDLDAGAFPDLVPTLAVLALFADGPCRLRGIAHLRLKESDRLAVLAENLAALGACATAGESSLTVDATDRRLTGAAVRTHGDHRMAMAFALAGLRIPGVLIDDPACVAKSNPEFWDRFREFEGAG
ncbi:3-phosphoshikimate 1-carboxyvinyltransferase, partial [bacterium]|nr:3-phosphoshikimate 1-carboxyvinyltransferase [bacterium]